MKRPLLARWKRQRTVNVPLLRVRVVAKTLQPTPGWKICRSSVSPRGGKGRPTRRPLNFAVPRERTRFGPRARIRARTLSVDVERVTKASSPVYAR